MRQKHLTVFLISALLGGNVAAIGQSSKKASDCAGTWTGAVTYTRTQTQTDNTTTERVSGRGTDTRNWEMNYDYKASVGIYEDKAGSSRVTANINHSLTSKETRVAVEKNSCDQGKTWQDMMGTFTTDTSVTGQGKEDANVHIGLNSDGTYSVSVGLPRIKGTVTGSQTSTFSGQCKPKEGKNLAIPATPTTIQGNSLTSDGSHRVDPSDPNRLSGSYSLSLPGGGAETISWNLERCGAPLRIVDLKFEDMKYPNWDDWQEISEISGTVDGNWVKIRAKVFNASGETKTGEVVLKETYKGDKWDGSRPDAPLKDQSFTVTLEPGEEREVEMVWDSGGYAWFDDGRPRLLQRIKAELRENDKKVDEMTRNLKVRPKPLVFVPGIWTSYNEVLYQNLLTTQHSYDWKACAVVDTSSHGTIGGEGRVKETASKGSVYAHADNLTTYVNSIRTSLNAWHIDMLAHSTGGLVARLYVHKQMEVLPDAYPVVKHLMLLGTPNNGVPCADSLLYKSAFEDHPQTAKELMPEEMALFNKYVTQRKGTRFSALVGDSIPNLCDGPHWSDGYVTVDSARYGIEDVTLTSKAHRDMLDTESFAGYVRARTITGPKGTYPYAAAAGK